MFILNFLQLLMNRGLENKILSLQSDQFCTLFANSPLKKKEQDETICPKNRDITQKNTMMQNNTFQNWLI